MSKQLSRTLVVAVVLGALALALSAFAGTARDPARSDRSLAQGTGRGETSAPATTLLPYLYPIGKPVAVPSSAL